MTRDQAVRLWNNQLMHEPAVLVDSHGETVTHPTPGTVAMKVLGVPTRIIYEGSSSYVKAVSGWREEDRKKVAAFLHSLADSLLGE